MLAPLQLQHIERPGYTIDLFVPDAREIQNNYFRQKQVEADVPFPHWTKLWPAALAMADHIYQHPELVQNKKVLELAAGLGLPSFIAARFAQSVCCSDYLDEAVDTMIRSARHLQLANVTGKVLNWNQLPHDITADVLILSDINYDPNQFDRLNKVLQWFLQKGTTILISTPQRLMAKPFIEKLLPWCSQQFEMSVEHSQQLTSISLLVLNTK